MFPCICPFVSFVSRRFTDILGNCRWDRLGGRIYSLARAQVIEWYLLIGRQWRLSRAAVSLWAADLVRWIVFGLTLECFFRNSVRILREASRLLNFSLFPISVPYLIVCFALILFLRSWPLEFIIIIPLCHVNLK